MVLLDRIVDHEPGEFLDALVCVSGNLDFIAGHFPERAIYPGSHLIQAFAQAGIILFQMSTSPLKEDEMTLVSSVEARFLKMVVPGDQVMLQLKVDRIVQNLFSFSAQARVGSTRVAACRINLARARVADVGSPLW
ncbi:MAG: beta-hydroxyacyl-ACP dehydratase [Myxococcaceae bacterium]|nr:beta-hydroxyacyl-ACP dehydratase [Myxococcaceae bacterium]